ncbi:hypothetical protein KOXY103107_16725 [Komagataeibacter xylinus]
MPVHMQHPCQQDIAHQHRHPHEGDGKTTNRQEKLHGHALDAVPVLFVTQADEFGVKGGHHELRGLGDPFANLARDAIDGGIGRPKQAAYEQRAELVENRTQHMVATGGKGEAPDTRRIAFRQAGKRIEADTACLAQLQKAQHGAGGEHDQLRHAPHQQVIIQPHMVHEAQPRPHGAHQRARQVNQHVQPEGIAQPEHARRPGEIHERDGSHIHHRRPLVRWRPAHGGAKQRHTQRAHQPAHPATEVIGPHAERQHARELCTPAIGEGIGAIMQQRLP